MYEYVGLYVFDLDDFQESTPITGETSPIHAFDDPDPNHAFHSTDLGGDQPLGSSQAFHGNSRVDFMSNLDMSFGVVPQMLPIFVSQSVGNV